MNEELKAKLVELDSKIKNKMSQIKVEIIDIELNKLKEKNDALSKSK